jgi:hypothetical protein
MSTHTGAGTGRTSEQGPIADVGAGDVLSALQLARTGRVMEILSGAPGSMIRPVAIV